LNNVENVHFFLALKRADSAHFFSSAEKGRKHAFFLVLKREENAFFFLSTEKGRFENAHFFRVEKGRKHAFFFLALQRTENAHFFFALKRVEKAHFFSAEKGRDNSLKNIIFQTCSFFF
jgi:hypothetical protein